MNPQPRPCSRCGRERDREGQRYCRSCIADYQRERYARMARALRIARRAGVCLEHMDTSASVSAGSVTVSRVTDIR
jgi:NMD protein affecting ribosome stability and mRNA decay